MVAGQTAKETPDHRPTVLRQGAGFVAVGGLSMVGFILVSTLALGANTGLPDWLVSSLCYAGFVGPAYLAHRRFAFRSAKSHSRALPRYVGVQVIATALASLLSVLASSVIGLPPLLGSVAIAGIVAANSFILSRFWVFAAKREAMA
jgi:putative flippase GtrA